MMFQWVSKLLGHSSMKIAEESYGVVVSQKVSSEVKRLNEKLNFLIDKLLFLFFSF